MGQIQWVFANSPFSSTLVPLKPLCLEVWLPAISEQQMGSLLLPSFLASYSASLWGPTPCSKVPESQTLSDVTFPQFLGQPVCPKSFRYDLLVIIRSIKPYTFSLEIQTAENLPRIFTVNSHLPSSPHPKSLAFPDVSFRLQHYFSNSQK